VIEFIDKRFYTETHAENAASASCWWTEKIGAEKLRAEASAKCDQTVVVAVLDTGVRLGHKALKIWETAENYKIESGETRICRGGSGFNHRPNKDDFNYADDRNGHGTRVAGIIAANGEKIKGVCPGATILPVKILDDRNELSCIAFITDGIKSVVYAKEEIGVNVRVVNISCGTSNGISIKKLNDLKAAIKDAERAGILIVASAGNAGLDIGERKNRHYPASIEADNLIAVAATDADDGKLPRSNYLESALGAPGDRIETLGLSGENSVLSDTSAAAAFVSGAAALLFSRFPALTCGEVKSALLETGEDESGRLKKYFSHGRLSVFGAYQKITRNQMRAAKND
jgi:subtilisin family serine protease